MMSETKFNQYYKDNILAIRNFANKLARNSVDAEDLVQETAIKAFRSRHTFRPGSSFKSWAFTILKNTFITKFNKRKKRAVVNKPIEDFTYGLENKYAVRNDALSKISILEIKKCINELSYKSKLPFLLHVEGYQYSEISDSLNIPIGTVKSRINFARTKLKTILNDKGIMAA